MQLPFSDKQASFIKQLLAEQQRHILCFGAGRNRTHAVLVRVTGHSFRLSPTMLRGLSTSLFILSMYTHPFQMTKMTNMTNMQKNTTNIPPLYYSDISMYFHVLPCTAINRDRHTEVRARAYFLVIFLYQYVPVRTHKKKFLALFQTANGR